MSPFKSYEALRLFVVVAQHTSFTAAGRFVNLTKGAVSYQVKQLEEEIGFALFERIHSGIALTERGHQLLALAQPAFRNLEDGLRTLQAAPVSSITVGASTYFSSRWLSSRLMSFLVSQPDVRLRLQPVIGPGDLQAEQLDLMIRWGRGNWDDGRSEPLFAAPAIATAGGVAAARIAAVGLAKALPEMTLLHDREGSVAWQDWFAVAGMPFRPKPNPLIIPDPNVRVEAVANGQGLALNDWLISAELQSNRLSQISPVELSDYGYYLTYGDRALENPAVRAFRDWIMSEPANAFPASHSKMA